MVIFPYLGNSYCHLVQSSVWIHWEQEIQHIFTEEDITKSQWGFNVKIGAQLSEARENGNLSFAIDFSFTSDQRMRGLLELCKPVTEGDKPKPVQCWIIVDTQ